MVRLTPLNKLLRLLKYNSQQLLISRKDDSSNELDFATHWIKAVELKDLLDNGIQTLESLFVCFFSVSTC